MFQIPIQIGKFSKHYSVELPLELACHYFEFHELQKSNLKLKLNVLFKGERVTICHSK